MFLEEKIRNLRKNHQRKQSNNHMCNILGKVKIVVGFWKKTLSHHSRSNLERRIYTHGTNHDHSENHERDDDKYKCCINTFFLHWKGKKYRVNSVLEILYGFLSYEKECDRKDKEKEE